MVNLAGYTGNAGLGLGSNPEIPVSANPNTLDVLNQTSRDLASWSNQQNAMLYQQKVRDRDNILEMIANDQVATGDALPEYLPKIREAIKEQNDIWKKWKGDPNDIEGALEYKQANQRAKDLAKAAQINTLQIKANRLEKSKEPIRARQKDYDDFEVKQLDKSIKGEGIVDPYQKNAYLDFDSMVDDYTQNAVGMPGGPVGEDVTRKTTVTDKGGKITTQQTTTAKPTAAPKGKQPIPVTIGANGLPSITSKQPDRVVDYESILGTSGVRFLEESGSGREQQGLLIEGVENLPPLQARNFIEGINNRIREYNSQTQGRATPVTELKEGVDYVEAINPATGEAQIKIKANTPEFAAKAVLARYPGNYFEAGAEVFNKDAGDFLLKNKKLAIDREKLGIDKSKANAYIDNMRAKTKKLMDNGVNEEQVKLMTDQFINDINLGSVLQKGKGGKEDVNVFFMDQIPTGYQSVIMTTDMQGKLTNKAISPFKSHDGRTYLKGVIYDQSGNEYKTDNATLRKKYKDNVAAGYSGSFDEYVKDAQESIKSAIQGGQFNVLMTDSEGNKISPRSILDAYRAINNQNASKKGQTELFVEESIPETSVTSESE